MKTPLLLPCVLVAFTSCSDDFISINPTDDSGSSEAPFTYDISFGDCKPGEDDDGDTIPNEVEGCKGDVDGDKLPDYSDSDADGDGISDRQEAGPNPKVPRDTDNDKVPDYKDTDSDGDTIDDGNEDLNGDGLLGCCLLTCGEQRKDCPQVKPDECGPGQTCNGGNCQPLVDFLCANGESDPLKAITFPGGKPDTQLPSFVCHKSKETSGKGLKKMQFRKNAAGGWHVALEPTSNYTDAVIKSAVASEAVATFDMVGLSEAVAGFIISKPYTGGDVAKASADLIAEISTKLPGKAQVSQQVSGSGKTSHDGFPTVVSTQLAITMSAAQNPPAVRNALLPVLLGRNASEIANLPPANFGYSQTELVLNFQTLLRPAEQRLLVMGAVGTLNMVNDTKKNTKFHLEDLANGTGLATLKDGDTVECDPFILESTPFADILWIIDESGSMDDNRQNIVDNATDFFNRAIKAGLDFRMGVAGMKDVNASGVKVGKLCSKVITSQTSADDGGVDRFLLSTEQTLFKGCIKNPPYYEGGTEAGLAHAFEAVTSHLPRAANDPAKIRAGATLVVVIATDEAPQELKGSYKYKGKTGIGLSYDINTCSNTKQAQIDAYVKDWIDLYTGKHPVHGAEAKAIVHLIGGVCKTLCGPYGPEFPWGYKEIVQATGGQYADICQKNLGTTLQKIIDSINGAASPAVLEYVPISASLAVALGQNQLERSREQGFDYDSASNSLLFLGVSFQKGDQVVASYRRWVKQGIPVN